MEGHLIRFSILLIMGVVYSVMSESLEQERKGKLILHRRNELSAAGPRKRSRRVRPSCAHYMKLPWIPPTGSQRLRRMLTLGCSSLEMSTGMVTRIDGDRYEIQQVVSYEFKTSIGGVVSITRKLL